MSRTEADPLSQSTRRISSSSLVGCAGCVIWRSIDEIIRHCQTKHFVHPLPKIAALHVSRYLDSSGLTGRTFTARDEQPGRDRVVALSYTLRSSQFCSDQSLVVRSIVLNGQSDAVIGVIPLDSP